MKLAHVDQLAVYYEPVAGRRTRVGRLARRGPGRAHLETLASRAASAKIIDEVHDAIRRFGTFAQRAGVPACRRDRVAARLAVRPSRRNRSR